MIGATQESLIDRLRHAALSGDGGSLTDAALLAAYVARRDDFAFAALVKRHGPMVLGVCRRVLRDDNDIDDVFQAAFLVLAQKAATVRPQEALGNWLHAVAYRTALQARRAAARRRKHEGQAAFLIRPVAEGADVEHRELALVLDQELSRLPMKFRLPVILCDLEGRTRRDAAEQLRLPDGTLSNRLASARQLLARRLSRRGFGPAAVLLATALPGTATAAPLPASLFAATARAVATLGLGPSGLAGAISPGVAGLMKGALQAMFWNRIKFVAVAVLTLGILGGGAAAFLHSNPATSQEEKRPDAKKDGAKPAAGAADHERILGVWDIVAMEESGVAQPEARFKDVQMRLVIAEKSLSIKTTTPDGRAVGPEGMTYVLNEKASPREIDVSKDGKTILGIYAFDQGKLKLCIDLEGTTRPADFKTKEGSEQRFYVLQKRKAAPKKAEKKGSAGEPK